MKSISYLIVSSIISSLICVIPFFLFSTNFEAQNNVFSHLSFEAQLLSVIALWLTFTSSFYSYFILMIGDLEMGLFSNVQNHGIRMYLVFQGLIIPFIGLVSIISVLKNNYLGYYISLIIYSASFIFWDWLIIKAKLNLDPIEEKSQKMPFRKFFRYVDTPAAISSVLIFILYLRISDYGIDVNNDNMILLFNFMPLSAAIFQLSTTGIATLITTLIAQGRIEND